MPDLLCFCVCLVTFFVEGVPHGSLVGLGVRACVRLAVILERRHRVASAVRGRTQWDLPV